MKINEPVTLNEIAYPEGKILVSKTDTKGAITFANKEFVEISGFTESELIGKNHNMVRHPDMPPAAFKDLWDTVKSGKPWIGLVKNRAKNGDFYWVKARVTPVTKNGNVVEYMSVRTKAERHEIQQAEALYAGLMNGSRKLDEGSWTAKLNFIKHLSINKKFAVIISALLVPIIVLTTLLINALNNNIDFAEKEINGVDYNMPVINLLQNISLHQGLVAKQKQGKAVDDKINATRSAIEQALTQLKQLDEAYGDAMKTADAVPQLQTDWQKLLTELGNQGLSESAAAHKAIISRIQALIGTIGDNSNLILDPDLDSYYLMDVVIVRLPALLEELAIVRDRSLSALGWGVDGTIKNQLLTDLAISRTSLSNTIRSMNVAFENNENLAPVLKPAIDEFERLARNMLAEADKVIVAEKTIDFDQQAIFDNGVAAIDAGYDLYHKTAPTLKDLLHNRIDNFAMKRNIDISIVTIIIIIALLVTRSVVNNISRPVKALSAAIRGMSEGDFLIDAGTANNDEIGDAVTATRITQINLQFNIADAQSKATEAMRIKLALDNNSTATTVSDNSNDLIYMNKAAHEQFSNMQAAWQQTAPAFDVNKLIGTKLSSYFEEGPFKDAYTKRLSGDTVLEGRFAGCDMRLEASPVYDENNNYVGRVTQWFDQTELLKEQAIEQERLNEERMIAAENERIRIALDNVSSNVMLADAARNIIYMNKNAAKLFTEAQADIRRDLPNFNAAKLIGTNIDGFHKNPSHQIGLLDNLKTEYVSQLEIGGRTMRIIANPVIDSEGQRLGTAVEWADRTIEVQVEKEIDTLVEAANHGNLTQRLQINGKSGFFLQLSEGFNGLLDQLTAVFDDIADVMGKMAEGDLTHKIDANYQGTFEEVKNNINRTIENVEQTVTRLRSISDSVGTAAEEILDGNNNLSSRTEQQAANLEETAASMEELTSTVKNNSDNAQQANSVASTARSAAETGGQVVEQAIDAMREINDSSSKIAEIIGVIDEIAFQTNLLALNASVEAARAGEQGRGFAVVASEVRNLASRSAEAAKEIKELIKDSVTKVQTGSELVDQTGHSLQQIVNDVKKVGDIIAEIAAASSEQTAGIEQINQAVTSLDEMTQQNAALAEETSAASATMSDSARNMQEVMSFFRT